MSKLIEAATATLLNAASHSAAIFNALNEGNIALQAAQASLATANDARLKDRPTLATAILGVIRATSGKVETRTTEKGVSIRYFEKDSATAKALAKGEATLLAKVIGAETSSARKHFSVCTQMAMDVLDTKAKVVTATEPVATTKAKARGKVAAQEEATATDRLFAALAKGKAVPAQPDAASPFGAAWASILQAFDTAAKLRAARIARAEKHAKGKANKPA